MASVRSTNAAADGLAFVLHQASVARVKQAEFADWVETVFMTTFGIVQRTNRARVRLGEVPVAQTAELVHAGDYGLWCQTSQVIIARTASAHSAGEAGLCARNVIPSVPKCAALLDCGAPS